MKKTLLKNENTLVKRFTIDIKKDIFLKLIIVFFALFFIFNSIFFAFNTKHGVPPDENYHIGLSKIFSKTDIGFFLEDNEFTYKFGLVSRTPFLYHYALGKISYLSELFVVEQILYMRLINILIGVGFLYFSYLFLRLVKTTYFERLFVFLMLSHTTMLFFLFGSVSYDNLINLFAVISFIFLLKIYEKFTIQNFLIWIIISCLGILTKFSYSPLVFLQFLTILHLFYKNKNMLSATVRKISTVKNMKIALGTAVGLSILVFYFYFGNFFLFKKIFPECTEVLTHEQCMQNGIYARDFAFKEDLGGHSLNSSLTVMTNYFFYVFNTQTTNMYHIFSHNYVHSHVNVSVILPLLFFVSFLLSLHYMKEKKEKYFIFIIFFYFLIVFYTVYKAYLNTGIRGIAVQGRYLFPIIIPFYWLMAKNFQRLFSKDLFKYLFIILVFILLNQLVYRDIFHQILLKQDDYAKHYNFVKNYNEVLYKVPRIRFLEF